MEIPTITASGFNPQYNREFYKELFQFNVDTIEFPIELPISEYHFENNLIQVCFIGSIVSLSWFTYNQIPYAEIAKYITTNN